MKSYVAVQKKLLAKHLPYLKKMKNMTKLFIKNESTSRKYSKLLKDELEKIAPIKLRLYQINKSF
jgi:hypothetical protein